MGREGNQIQREREIIVRNRGPRLSNWEFFLQGPGYTHTCLVIFIFLTSDSDRDTPLSVLSFFTLGTVRYVFCQSSFGLCIRCWDSLLDKKKDPCRDGYSSSVQISVDFRYVLHSRLDIENHFFPIFQKQKVFIIWKEKDMLSFVATEQMLGEWR